MSEWPKRFDVGGMTAEVHAPWCPIEAARAKTAGNDFVIWQGEPLAKCRCAVRLITTPAADPPPPSSR